jgi:hypothetical protein
LLFPRLALNERDRTRVPGEGYARIPKTGSGVVFITTPPALKDA